MRLLRQDAERVRRHRQRSQVRLLRQDHLQPHRRHGGLLPQGGVRDLRGGLDPDNHTDLKHFPAQRATILREGNIEYWYCSGCGKYYKDAKATIEITQEDTVIPKVKRDNSGIPSHGGETGKTDKNDKTVQSVKTGDAGVALYGAMALLSLTGGAWIVGKKRRS